MKYPEYESATVEWKSTFPKNDQIAKPIIGFCNRSGGKLIIGVDNTGDIVGVDENKIQDLMEYVDKMIYDAAAPPIIPLVYSQRIGDKTLLIIEVSSGMNKPYYLKSEGLEKGTYVRVGRSTLKADAGMIEELKWLSRGLAFDTMPVYHAREQDISIERVEHFLKEREGRGKESVAVSKELFLSYHILVEEHSRLYPTVAGMLLFGREPQHFFPEAFIICTHFSAEEGAERRTIATMDCTGTLFEQYERAFDFIVTRLYRSFVIEGKKRHEELEIPPVAIREILLNAIVHRNYHIQAPIRVAVYATRVEIFSPGDFPGPINPNNILSGLTYIRNGAICKVFRQAGYIEKLGSGFLTVFQVYEKQALPAPQVVEGDNFVKCILPRKASLVYEEKKDVEDAYTKQILHLFELSNELSISDVMNVLHIPRATAGRRLQALVKAGILKKVGKARGSAYRKV